MDSSARGPLAAERDGIRARHRLTRHAEADVDTLDRSVEPQDLDGLDTYERDRRTGRLDAIMRPHRPLDQRQQL